MTEKKLLCYYCEYHPAACEAVIPGIGRNEPILLCRSCMEGFSDYDDDEVESDDTLIFCKREWELQGK